MKELGSRLLQLTVVFVVVTFFVVALMSLVPGKPEDLVITYDGTPDQSLKAQFREDNDLDDPLVIRWAKWAGGFVTGDMGNLYSATGKDPVSDTVKSAAPISALLILYTQILALAVSIPLAVIAAYRNGKWADKIISGMAFSFLSLPGFAVALILSYLLGVKLGFARTTGYDPPSAGFMPHFKSVLVPVLALSLGQIAVYMRLLRSDLVATLQEDFILMAKSKGISNRRVLWRHALRPSSLTLLTVVGLNVGNLIGGTLVVEALFSIPGMGLQIADAVLSRQYAALQSYVALIAIFFVLVNFLVDYLYTVLDPRIRERGA
jgi:peptide/nickel transport system permease protein